MLILVLVREWFYNHYPFIYMIFGLNLSISKEIGLLKFLEYYKENAGVVS